VQDRIITQFGGVRSGAPLHGQRQTVFAQGGDRIRYKSGTA
jgi:hypothetical protein